MVQFVFTPWRNRAELLRVRQQLYPSFTTTATGTATKPPPSSPWWSSPDQLHDIERAIARVFMWVHRGGCPHVVESTALLMSAIVFDARGPHDAVANAAVVAGYLVGFTRFVTGLLDSHQDKARKLSMYGVAKTIGLPASFVELRHQGTHEPMPSLTQLRPAARRALVWIWEYYWRNLPEEEEDVVERADVTGTGSSLIMGGDSDDMPTDAGNGDMSKGKGKGKEKGKGKGQGTPGSKKEALEERMCRAALLGNLQRQEGEVGEDAARDGLMRQLQQWDDALVMRVLADIGGSTRDSGMLLRSVKLSRAILGLETAAAARGLQGEEGMHEEEMRKELIRARDEVERGETRSIWGTVTGKRKKGTEDDEGDEGSKRRGWFTWKGPWRPKPIGVL